MKKVMLAVAMLLVASVANAEEINVSVPVTPVVETPAVKQDVKLDLKQPMFDKMSNVDLGMEAAYMVVSTMDWAQTRNMAQRHYTWNVNGEQRFYHESNPVLGNHPSKTKIDLYFVSTDILHYAVAKVIPAGPWRSLWQGLTVTAEAYCVMTNFQKDIDF